MNSRWNPEEDHPVLTLNPYFSTSRPTIGTELNAEPSPSNNYTYAAQMLFFLLSLGLAIIYLEPSKECSDSPDCGEWLKKIFNSKEIASAIFFIAGALTAALTGGYFGAQGIKKIIEVLGPLPVGWEKILKAAGIAGVTFSQLVHIFITAKTTHSNFWEILISVLGYLPPALFTAVNLPSEFPPIKNEIKNVLMQIQNGVFPTSNSAYYTHYLKEKIKFDANLENHWRSLCQEATAYEQDGTRILPGFELDHVLKNPQANVDRSLGTIVTTILKTIGAGTGYFIAGAFNYVIMVNAITFFKTLTDDETLASLAAAFFSLAPLYTNFKLIPSAISSSTQILCDFLRSVPINSLYLYLNKKILLISGGATLGLAPLSYALVKISADNALTPDRVPDDILRLTLWYSTLIGIVLYHGGGGLNFTTICASVYNSLTKNMSAIDLERTAKVVAETLRMPVDQFISLIENLSDAQLKLYKITPYIDIDRPGVHERLVVNDAPHRSRAAQAAERLSINDDSDSSPTNSSRQLGKSWFQSSLSFVSSVASCCVRDAYAAVERQPIVHRTFKPYG